MLPARVRLSSLLESRSGVAATEFSSQSASRVDESRLFFAAKDRSIFVFNTRNFLVDSESAPKSRDCPDVDG